MFNQVAGEEVKNSGIAPNNKQPTPEKKMSKQLSAP